MTNIHFPTDGQGTQALKQKNKTNNSSFHIDAVAPDAKNQNPAYKKEKTESEEKNNEAGKSPDSDTKSPDNEKAEHQQVARSIERRKDNRRSENLPVLLNTRSAQDRRKNPGQREDDLDNTQKNFGIDTKA